MRHLIREVGILFLSIVILAGCKGAKSGANGESAPARQHSPNGFELRYIPKWHPQAQFSGIYMAVEKGIYAQHGLDVKIQEVLQSDAAVDSLLNGAADVIHLDLLAALKINQDKLRLVNIAQIAQKNPVLLVGKKSNGINSIADFEGKKIGVWRSGSYLSTYAFLQDRKLNMEFFPIDWSISLFIEEVVDVINVMRYNEYHQLLQAGLSKDDLFVVDLHELGYSVPDEGLYVTPEFFAAHPQQCKDFTTATMDGWLYAFSHLRETVSIILEKMSAAKIRANKSLQRSMLKEMKPIVMPSTAEMGILKREDYQNAQTLHNKMSHPLKDIPYEEFYPYAAQ
jgi:NitT/TauT family transport system substrate-binding protein